MPTALLAEQAAYYRARAYKYDEWWQRLARHDHGPEATRRVFFIDSRLDITLTARDDKMPSDDGIQERRLNAGRTFRIVKLYYDPESLSERLRKLGSRATCAKTSRCFLYGETSPA